MSLPFLSIRKALLRMWNQFEKKLMALPFLDHPLAQRFQSNQNYVFLALVLLISFMSFQFHIYPKFLQLQQLKTNHDLLEKNLELAKAHRRRLEQKQLELAERLKVARGRLFSPQEALKFSNGTLPQLIADSGCHVELIKRQAQAQVNEVLFQLPLDIKVTGTTPQLAKLINALRSLTQRVVFKEMLIEPIEKKDVSMTATLVLYYALP